MGVLRAIGMAFLAFLILIVGVPILLFIAGLTAPLWGALYQASLHAFGPGSTLTWITYEIYQFTLMSNKYVVHYVISGGSGGGSNNGGSGGGCS
jgi:uncharacterized membrane protein YgcG